MPTEESQKRYARAQRQIERRAFQLAGQSVQYVDGKVKSQSVKYVPARDAHKPLPDHLLKGRSSLLDSEGNVIQRWEIERLDATVQEQAWRAVADELSRDIFRVAPTPPPDYGFADQLTVVPVGDLHLGMYAWDKEAGADYDLAIGENDIAQAGRELMLRTRPCETALIALLGDYLHYDSMVPETPAHHNKLDADTRAQRMVRVAIRSAVRLIKEALAHHKMVHVIVESGNHDGYSSGWLRETLAWHFENEERVTIDLSPAKFHYFEFGLCLIGTNHGDEVKMEALPLIMAADRPEAWGRTKFRYWITGHVHHSQKQMAVLNKDFKNVSVESFRVIPPEDAWAAGQGHRSICDIKALTLSRKWGEVGRVTVNPGMWR